MFVEQPLASPGLAKYFLYGVRVSREKGRKKLEKGGRVKREGKGEGGGIVGGTEDEGRRKSRLEEGGGRREDSAVWEAAEAAVEGGPAGGRGGQ